MRIAMTMAEQGCLLPIATIAYLAVVGSDTIQVFGIVSLQEISFAIYGGSRTSKKSFHKEGPGWM